ncbi:MAG: shikimate kinase [Nakamurella sp.]
MDEQQAASVNVTGGPAVILIGPPGAGKTTVALALGALTGLPVRDTDADVELESGRIVGEIFTQSGEAEFRRLEHIAVAKALAEHEGILSLGGGAVMEPETGRLLAGHPVVFLSISMKTGLQRTGLSDQRPMFVGVNPRGTFKALLDARVPVYRAIATLEIDTDHLTVNEVAARIIAELGLKAGM